MGVAAVGRDEVAAPERAREEAAPERAVGHQRDAELAQERDDLRLEILDRRLRIDAVLVVDVDVVDAEPFQARLAGDRHVVGPAIDDAALAVGPAHVAEFGGDQHLVAPASRCCISSPLVGSATLRAALLGTDHNGEAGLHPACVRR
jgi:hypothetical protein